MERKWIENEEMERGMFSIKVTGAASFHRHVWCFWVWYWYRLAKRGPEKYRVNIFLF